MMKTLNADKTIYRFKNFEYCARIYLITKIEFTILPKYVQFRINSEYSVQNFVYDNQKKMENKNFNYFHC